MWLIDSQESRFNFNNKKGQFTFDLALTLVILSFILYFGLSAIAEIHATNEKNLDEQVLFNKIISVADYLVKEGAVETKQIFQGTKAIYHHELNSNTLIKVNTSKLKEKLKLKELTIDICQIEGCNNIISDTLCVNRIVLFEDNISILRVCGR